MHRNPCLRAVRKSTSAERVGPAVGFFWVSLGNQHNDLGSYWSNVEQRETHAGALCC